MQKILDADSADLVKGTLQSLGLTPEKSATPAGGDVSNMEGLDYSSEDVSHEGTDEDGIDETDEDERDESDQDEPDEVEGTRDLGDVCYCYETNRTYLIFLRWSPPLLP